MSCDTARQLRIELAREKDAHQQTFNKSLEVALELVKLRKLCGIAWKCCHGEIALMLRDAAKEQGGPMKADELVAKVCEGAKPDPQHERIVEMEAEIAALRAEVEQLRALCGRVAISIGPFDSARVYRKELICAAKSGEGIEK